MTGQVVHGGLTTEEREAYARRGIDLLDLSANLNPYGPLPAVVQAARDARLNDYPEADAMSLRRQYAAACALSPDQVLAGNGSTELFYLLARAFLHPGDRCVVAAPTFGEYAAAATSTGAEVRDVPCMTPEGTVDPDLLLRAVREDAPRMVFLCNPNNPTGALLPGRSVDELAAAICRTGGRLVVDEAYAAFAYPRDEASSPGSGRLIVRSLTKEHAIPGLRVGFLLGAPGDIAAVARHQPSWAVGAPAMAAGQVALEQPGFVRESAERLAATRSWLVSRLRDAGFTTADTWANFVLVEVGDGAAFRQRLLGRGFAVRDCASFGLPRHVRVAVPAEQDAAALVAAMEEVRE